MPGITTGIVASSNVLPTGPISKIRKMTVRRYEMANSDGYVDFYELYVWGQAFFLTH